MDWTPHPSSRPSPTSLATTPSSIDPMTPPITGPTSQPATGRSMSLGAVARSRTKWSRKMRVRSLSLRRAASTPRKCVRPCPPLPPLWPLSSALYPVLLSSPLSHPPHPFPPSLSPRYALLDNGAAVRHLKKGGDTAMNPKPGIKYTGTHVCVCVCVCV